jgi:hypothetical protein
MKRSAGVTAAAILMLIGSVLSLLLFSAMAAAIFMLSSKTWVRMLPGPILRFEAAKVSFRLGMFLFGGVMGLLTGIGLLRLRNWARIATIVFASALILIIIPALLVALLVPPYSPASSNASLLHTYRVVLIIPTAISILIAGWWLPYFTSARVRGQFEPDKWWNPTSDPVRIAAWLMVVIGLIVLAGPIGHLPGIYFLFRSKRGITGNLVGLQALWSVIAAIGLLKLHHWAFAAATSAQVWAVVNGVMGIIGPIRQQVGPISWAGVRYSSVAGAQITDLCALAITLLDGGILLCLLITRRRPFFAACEAARLPAPPPETTISL